MMEVWPPRKALVGVLYPGHQIEANSGSASTTTPSDVIGGIVNILVGFAPLWPIEFVIN